MSDERNERKMNDKRDLLGDKLRIGKILLSKMFGTIQPNHSGDMLMLKIRPYAVCRRKGQIVFQGSMLFRYIARADTLTVETTEVTHVPFHSGCRACSQ